MRDHRQHHDAGDPRGPATFRASLWRAVRVKLVLFALLGVVGGSYFSCHPRLQPERPVVRELPSELTMMSTDAMLAEHSCWTSSGPKGVVPGHVVLTLAGDDHPTYGGRRLTAAALEQLFAEGPAVGVVHGFCP